MRGKVSVILVEPSHPGNIGAAARAMKVMGLQHLVLVNPSFFPDAQATAMAAGADDLLAHALLYPNLAEALKDCRLVFGTSARSRACSLPVLTPHELGQKVVEAEHNGIDCAIVFGRESNGLSNHELASCHYHVQIPSCVGFSSLNLAAAVQVISYEYRLSALAQDADYTDQPVGVGYGAEQPAKAVEVEHLVRHTEQLLEVYNFAKREHLPQIMLKIQRIFQKARLESSEVAILEGILTMFERH